MTSAAETITLPGAMPGTSRQLRVFNFGEPGARPKVYIQAGLHADEPPGMMILRELCKLLTAAEDAGQITGEIILIPMANPLGIDQAVNSAIMGRFELRTGTNFNRAWPNFGDGLADAVRKRLGDDPEENVEIVRRELKRRVASLKADSPAMAQRIALTRRAYDADLVVDLHSDDESLTYMMSTPELWDEAKRFAADVGVHSLQPSGNGTGAICFDECFLKPWTDLHAEFGDRVPAATKAFTFEMGGVLDVDPKQAARHAQGFLRYLRRIGCLAGNAPRKSGNGVEEFNEFEMLDSPAGGLLLYPQELGEWVSPGDVIAEIVDPSAPDLDAPPMQIKASMKGCVVSRRLSRQVSFGDFVIMLGGREKPKSGKQKSLID
ncbi:MAG TPA: succinylglutamate desuccinylase/aspartoacylase family protein [Dongiaceae bacterium]|nr:succinylglutamate desuccinylase/aspartoacylase family protein [Dongiaceae bacterium]